LGSYISPRADNLRFPDRLNPDIAEAKKSTMLSLSPGEYEKSYTALRTGFLDNNKEV
jgi:hypothetical protein